MLFLRLVFPLALFLLPLAISGKPGWWQGWIAPGLMIVFVSVNGVLLRSRHSVSTATCAAGPGS